MVEIAMNRKLLDIEISGKENYDTLFLCINETRRLTAGYFSGFGWRFPYKSSTTLDSPL